MPGTFAAASKLYHKRKQQVLEGRKLPEGRRKTAVSFDKILEDAIESSKAHDSAEHHYNNSRKKGLVLEWFGGRNAASITSQEIERKLSLLAEQNRAAGTLNRYRSFLSHIFTLAVRNKNLSVNPVREVKRRKENNARVRFLENHEEAILRKRIPSICPEREPEFDLALHTGLRQSEQYALLWENVNVKRSVITVPRSKSGEKRHVPIKSVAEKAFKSLLVDRNESGRVVPLLRPPVRGNGRRKRYSPRWFRDGVVQRSGITNFHWHDLRHTFASRLVMKGVPLSTVQELMGHKTIQMTVRYAHLAASDLKEAV